MRKSLVFAAVASLVFSVSPAVFATNGDNMTAIGPIARSMGGVGVANPLDPISSVFANPAAMCFSPYCESSEFNFSGSMFRPKVDAKVTHPSDVIDTHSDEKTYMIPAIGLSVPITNKAPYWRFGIAAYGVTGLGVDYRGTALDDPNFLGSGYPLIVGEFTQLQIMKFSPAFAFKPHDKWSFGFALHVDYSNFDVRKGTSFNYGYGAQLGLIYMPNSAISLGASYTSPQNVDHEKLADFDQDGTYDTLKVESPQQIAFGAAWKGQKLVLEADAKWINWAGANGYKDLDWDDQWIFALGQQFQPVPRVSIRAGYNYGKNPVIEHNDFSGVITLQGKTMPTYYCETLRIIGFPAIVEHHLTLGFGYEFSKSFSIHAGYVHAFEKSISENGMDVWGQPVSLESTLNEKSFDFGLSFRF